METDEFLENHRKELSSSEKKYDVINVRAIMICPNGDFRKVFKNQFPRNNIELMIVALKIFDWLTCVNCGELLNLDLEFEV